MSQEVRGVKLPDNKAYAFPFTVSIAGPTGTVHCTCPGMDLRDYFAAQALLTMPDWIRETQKFADPMDRVAQAAYAIADAMMRVRAER